MSAPPFVILIVCFASIALADDFKTTDGKEYKNAKVSRIEPDGVVIAFSGGIVKIPFTELSPELQKKYGYDSKAAEAYSAEENQKQVALQQQRKEEENKRTEERHKYWSERATTTPMQNGDSSDDQAYPSSPNTSREQGPRNCYMEVRNVLSALEIQRNWETNWGSYDRDHFGRLILNIRLGTVGRSGGPMKVQWFFIGRKLIDMNTLVIYGKGEKMVEVPARYFVECYAAAPIVKSHTLNLAALGERHVSGVLPDSWIVCASDSKNHVLADKASSEPSLALFNDADQFSKLQSLK
jgi:hypothetical protein